MARSGTRITKVELAGCNLSLERPIHLGSVRVDSRDYVCLRLSTDAGIEGFSIGYRSGSQLFHSLQALAPRLLGRDPLMRQELNAEMEKGLIPARASYVRALSLIDIALWDITAKLAGLPLYQVLGGLRCEVPAIPVLGFSYSHRPLIDIQNEVAAHRDKGETLVKLMISGKDTKENIRYVKSMTSSFEGEVDFGVDAHWSWRTLPDAMSTCRELDDCGLTFLEDPFLPQQWRLAGELRSRLRTPIAVGEDVLDPYGFFDLTQNVDILRVDATGSGGVTAAMNAMALAAAQGRRAFPHVFPYLHLHLACAQNAVMGVEYIPEHTGTDPVRTLLKEFPAITDGKFQISDTPGSGCELDWGAVTENAAETSSFEHAH